MFDIDKWQDILSTLKHNRFRVVLTMFSVFWGIYMLIALLGASAGLKEGVMRGFGSTASNSVFVWARSTGKPYKGLKPGRRIRMNGDDVTALRTQIDSYEYLTPRIRRSMPLSFGDNSETFSIYGDYPDIRHIAKLDIYNGRHIDAFDIEENRKVVLIGDRVRETLFGDKEAVGEYVKINRIPFMVIGVFKSFNSGRQAEQELRNAYVPFTTLQRTFNFKIKVHWLAMTAKPGVQSSQLEQEVKSLIKSRHRVHPDDTKALGSFNLERQYTKISGLMSGIGLFSWIVGIGTLLAGLVGVSNIMLIVVKERTREIGIRKAMGATPLSIVSMVIQESLLITLVAGYAGLFLGIVTLEAISFIMRQAEVNSEFFSNPHIDFKIAVSALLVIVLGGVLAGLVPAKRASSIHPVAAIRAE